jgi:alkylhydroperoxidase/carboxymuconolactone decarboxylase family protein YurZ
MDESERLKIGMAKRRKVLGDAWVDRAEKNRSAFNAEWQDFITRYPWGDTWTRPGLDERTRRVLVIGTLLALQSWEEFRLHVRSAVGQGALTADEIKEIVWQQAHYCGVPAGNNAMRHAEEAIKEAGKAS